MRFAADENFSRRILRGLLRRLPALDLVRVQDIGLAQASDPEILAWAAREGRLLLTHDANTMTKYAGERVAAGESMPGVIQVSQKAPIGSVIEDLVLLEQASMPEEHKGQVLYLPF